MHSGRQDHPESQRKTKRERAEADSVDAPLARPPELIHPTLNFVMPLW